MQLKTNDFLYQSHTAIDRQGRRTLTIRRRRVLAVDADRIAVTGFESMTVPIDQPHGDYTWTGMQGLMGMDSTLTLDQLSNYSTSFKLTGSAA